MLSSPEVGDRVQVWYGRKWRKHRFRHDRLGTIVALNSVGPHIHAVEMDHGSTVHIPAENLRTPKEADA